jgi:hypothetical protein
MTAESAARATPREEGTLSLRTMTPVLPIVAALLPVAWTCAGLAYLARSGS